MVRFITDVRRILPIPLKQQPPGKPPPSDGVVEPARVYLVCDDPGTGAGLCRGDPGEMPFSMSKKVWELENDEQRKRVDKRLLSLVEFMTDRYGICRLRNDSRLAYCWAVGSLDMTMEEVAAEIFRMHRLFNHTDYKAFAERVVQAVTDDLYHRCGMDQRTASVLAKRYMIPAAKRMYSEREIFGNEPSLAGQSAAEPTKPVSCR